MRQKDFWFFLSLKRTGNNSKVIFSVMGIPDEEPNLEIYYKLIEQGADLEHEKIEELAEGIFRELMGYSF